jgi:hypothetical protein
MIVKHEFRIDFRTVNIGSEEAPEMVAVPDPDRYEYISDDTREGWLDKLDGRDLLRFVLSDRSCRAYVKEGDRVTTY